MSKVIHNRSQEQDRSVRDVDQLIRSLRLLMSKSGIFGILKEKMHYTPAIKRRKAKKKKAMMRKNNAKKVKNSIVNNGVESRVGKFQIVTNNPAGEADFNTGSFNK